MTYATTNQLARKLCGLPPIQPNQQSIDAARYNFLKEYYALDSDECENDFKKLAFLSGAEFDAAVDAAMAGETDEEEEEPGYCPSCDGSGEGMHEGTRCYRCKGKGHA
jgi:hypothetical protein